MPDFEHWLGILADTAVIFTLGTYTLFAAIYGIAYPWRKRRAGRAVFFAHVTIVLVALISYLAIWVGPDYWLRPLWRAVAWVFAAYAGGYLLYALLRNWNAPEPLELPVRTGSMPTTQGDIMPENVTTDEAGQPTLKPQPKVIAGAVAGIGLTVLVGAINAITPDLFAFLGDWGPVVFAGVVALGGSLAAYIKRPSADAS